MTKPPVISLNKRTCALRIAMLVFSGAVSLPAATQLYIGPGAQVQLKGNAALTLNNIDLVNNGTFSAGNSTVIFSGAGNVVVSGAQPVQFYTIQISKDPGTSMVLQRPVGLSNQLQFLQGYMDLNGQNLDLGATGQLIGESEASRILGPAGGEVVLNTPLNAPSAVNPGNLGALISSPRDLGNVEIRRGHRVQSLPGKSILRYYAIHPTNNSGLGATLRFYYFDAELNNLRKNTLVPWRSPDGLLWSEQGLTTYDAVQNYVEKTAIDAFSIWTLSASAAALPVIFTHFQLQCDGNKVILSWKTAQESNSSYFSVERNSGAGWISIGRLPAAGNSSMEKSYEFTDPNPADKAQYRVAQYDLDGRVKYTSVITASCAVTNSWQVGPNPFGQTFTVRIQSERNDQAKLRVMDAGGVVILNRQLNLIRGLNQFEVDLQKAASGAYLLWMEWQDGHQVKTMRLIKQ